MSIVKRHCLRIIFLCYYAGGAATHAQDLSAGPDPFAFEPEKENHAPATVAKLARLPFRNKRPVESTLLQPVIKVPRLTTADLSRATDSESPDMEIRFPSGSQGDRQSPFTPNPEPGGLPTGPQFRVPSGLVGHSEAGDSNPNDGAKHQGKQAVARHNIDPEIQQAADELCKAVADSRCSSAHDSAVGDLCPALVTPSCTEAMSDAFSVLYRNGDFCDVF